MKNAQSEQNSLFVKKTYLPLLAIRSPPPGSIGLVVPIPGPRAFRSRGGGSSGSSRRSPRGRVTGFGTLKGPGGLGTTM